MKKIIAKLRVKPLAIPFVAALAALPFAVAESSVSAACWVFMHQPEEPANMAERLKARKAGGIDDDNW